MSVHSQRLRQRLEDRSARIGIIGVGYVGLPLAVAFGKAGFSVLGVDVARERVARLNAGESPVEDVGSDDLATLVAARRLSVTTDSSVLGGADAIIICVPTPLGKSREPDISHIVAAADAVATILRPGQLVVLESTTYPGTTEEVLLPRFRARGLTVGEEFFLAFSPERIDPGNKRFDLRAIPKLVGGVTPTCSALTRVLYGQIIDRVVPVSGPQTAEMVKLFENIFRSVNIALVNELAIMCRRLGLSVWEVIEAAATKPFGFMPFYPGPGIGGHCFAAWEWVYCHQGEGVEAEQLTRVWDRAARSGGAVERQGDVETVHRPNLQVLGIAPDGRQRWEGVETLCRRWFEGDLISIATADGREITVTDRHPMLVLTAESLEVREAREVAEGDLLPTFSGLSDATAARENPTLDVISILSPPHRAKTRVRIVGGSWEAYKPALYRAHGWTARDFIRDEAVPLPLYLRLEGEGSVPRLRERLLLMTGRGPSWSSLPAILELTPEFARLVGYYLSEGCITEDRSLRVRFAFHVEETEYIDDLIQLLNGVGLRVSVYKDRLWQTLHIKVSSSLFGAVMRDGLGCGLNSYNMRIPPLLLGASERHRLALLVGLFRGDGDVWARTGFYSYRKRGRVYRHRHAAVQVGYFSASEALARGVVYLLQSLGFAPRLSRIAPPGLRIRLYGASTVERLAPLLGGEKGRRLQESLESRRRRPRSRVVRRVGGVTAVPVASVRRLPGPTLVYSVETAETHTLAVGYGQFVHNCLPSDPHYLSWRTRLMGYEPKFIAFADEINRQMPTYVGQMVTDALNDRGRPVRGVKILALGVAYKAGVGDVRDSPAVEILDALLARGAEVSYVDPHVPTLAVGDRRLAAVPWQSANFAAQDLVLILTNHPEFDLKRVAAEAPLVVDTRNATGFLGPRPNIIRL